MMLMASRGGHRGINLHDAMRYQGGTFTAFESLVATPKRSFSQIMQN